MNNLIFVRHGQSLWNKERRFTGWADIELTEKGKMEAKKAGELINNLNIDLDAYFSSNFDDAMILTIDRITDQVTDIEKEFESKLDKLGIENSNLRNQIVSLKQSLNSEISDTKSIEVDLVKPETNSSIPSTIISETIDLIEVIEPQTENPVHKIVLKEFDNDIYTEGVIFYNNEQYDKCIESLSSLPLDHKEVRNTSKALFFLADSYEKVGRYKRALSCLESLSSFNDDNYSELILFKKGIIYRDIGMRNKAQRVFQTLVDFYPESEFKIFAEQEIQNI